MSESPLTEIRRLADGDDVGSILPASVGNTMPVPDAGKPGSFRRQQGHFVDMLVEASQGHVRGAVASVAAQMMAHGISAEEIADTYIPAAARRMGDLWCDDHMGFAGVTVGCSRLQALLRDMGPDWRADNAGAADGPTLLVLVASDICHTLGATVLAGQLRRRGLSVRLLIGARPEDVGPMLRQIRFDAVLISASVGESLESLRKLVDAVGTATMTPPPVAIGGTILTAPGFDRALVKTMTGADHVTSDPIEALDLCGVILSARTNRRRARKS